MRGSRCRPRPEYAPARTYHGWVVLRCTAKALKLLGARTRDLVSVEPTDQDWYANLLWLDGRKCLLLAHAGTLFSVLVPDIRKADLVPIGPSITAFIQQELEAEDFPPDRLGVLDSSIRLARTESRSILGYMNEMARFCGYAVEDSGGLARSDARELNHRLRRELHLTSKPPGYFVPIELAGGSRERNPNVPSRPFLRLFR